MKRKYILPLVGLFALTSISSSLAGTIKYTNQKAGQFCKTIEVGSSVVTKAGIKLTCRVVTSGSKPHWTQIASTVKKAQPLPTPELLPGLIPEFPSTYYAVSAGLQMYLPNVNSAFTWLCESTSGTCEVSVTSGILTFLGKIVGDPITITVNTSRIGYANGSNSLTFSPKLTGITPVIQSGSIRVLSGGASFQIGNYDASWIWTVQSTAGTATIDATGLVMVSNLGSQQNANVTVSAHKTGYLDQSATTQVTSLPVFKSLTLREWELIAKDPTGNTGSFIIVYGHITQFDTSTGLSNFRADISGVNLTSSGYWIGGDNTLLTGDPATLSPFVLGDTFIADVKVLGAYTYTSTLNAKISVPQLQIYSIQLVH